VECLQGLREADGGSMRILGLDVAAHPSELRQQVGSQLQDAALPDRLRVREALELLAADGTVDTGMLMRTWGLDEHATKPFARLSGGRRQRLFITLALLNRPAVVFFDELTQGPDPLARRSVWDVIRQVRELGMTIVLVTLFMDEAEQLCDRLAVFAGGRIVHPRHTRHPGTLARPGHPDRPHDGARRAHRRGNRGLDHAR
jgi:ABC-2 type transport system ATP-binding protein